MEDKVTPFECIDKFLKKIEKENPLHFESILKDMDIVEKVGIKKSIQAETIKKVKGEKEKIYELRISVNKPNTEYRLMGTIRKNELCLVHGHKKKEQKTRKEHINMTKKRLKKLKLI